MNFWKIKIWFGPSPFSCFICRFVAEVESVLWSMFLKHSDSKVESWLCQNMCDKLLCKKKLSVCRDVEEIPNPKWTEEFQILRNYLSQSTKDVFWTAHETSFYFHQRNIHTCPHLPHKWMSQYWFPQNNLNNFDIWIFYIKIIFTMRCGSRNFIFSRIIYDLKRVR